MSDSPLKWHGGKHYLAPKIIGLMPKRHHPKDNPGGWLHYVEPYAGGLSVLLAQDPEGISEVANDLDGRLTNFWRCLIHDRSFEAFRRMTEATPFCESVFRCAQERLETPCEADPAEICQACAACFFVVCRQSLAGRMKGFASISRTRVRRGMNEQCSAWLSAVEGLPEVHGRLKRVVILNRKARALIPAEDGPKTLFYLDPPYLHETRATTQDYAFEMTVGDHAELLTILGDLKGKFLLSGYRSSLYDEAAKDFGWHRTDFDLPNNAAGGDTKRIMTECVWTNYHPGA